MRTESEILDGIKRLEKQKDAYAILECKPFKAYQDIANGQIRALRWALGYSVGDWYWCNQCQIQHEGLKCPECGNEKKLVAKPVEV